MDVNDGDEWGADEEYEGEEDEEDENELKQRLAEMLRADIQAASGATRAGAQSTSPVVSPTLHSSTPPAAAAGPTEQQLLPKRVETNIASVAPPRPAPRKYIPTPGPIMFHTTPGTAAHKLRNPDAYKPSLFRNGESLYHPDPSTYPPILYAKPTNAVVSAPPIVTTTAQAAAISTIRQIVAFCQSDELVREMLITTVVGDSSKGDAGPSIPDLTGASPATVPTISVFASLNRALSVGRVSKMDAKTLRLAVAKLSQSTTLFGSSGSEDEPAGCRSGKPANGKRKRAVDDNGFCPPMRALQPS